MVPVVGEEGEVVLTKMASYLLPAAVAFMRLRVAQPGLHRPFAVPGGSTGAWAAAVSVVGFAVFSVAASATDGAPVFALPCVIGIPATLGLLAWLKERFLPTPQAQRESASCTRHAPVDDVTEKARPADDSGVELAEADSHEAMAIPEDRRLLATINSG